MHEEISQPHKKVESSPLPDLTTFDAQIAFFEKYPERITPQYINNFFLNMPGAWRRSLPLKKESVGKNLKERLMEEFKNSDTLKNQLLLYSEKRLLENREEFFAEVDQVLKDLGIDFEEPPRPDDPPLIRAYLELRRRGYKHFDLVS